jgi:hypothetical protein
MQRTGQSSTVKPVSLARFRNSADWTMCSAAKVPYRGYVETMYITMHASRYGMPLSAAHRRSTRPGNIPRLHAASATSGSTAGKAMQNTASEPATRSIPVAAPSAAP